MKELGPPGRPGSRGGWRAALLAALALLGTAVLFYADRIVAVRSEDGAVWVGSDLTTYFQPVFEFTGNELKAGNLPIWNPHQLAGQPHLGLHVPALLYPPSLLLLRLLPNDLALDFHAIAHLAIAGFFTWLLARRLGCGAPAAGIAALGYMLAAPTFLSIQMTAYLSTQAWLPAQLWALHGLLEEVRARWALAIAVTTALAFLGGHAQGFLFQAQLLALYGLFGLFAVARSGTRARALGLGLLGALAAAGLAAPQLVPALELALRSVRGLGLGYAAASIGALEPERVARALLGWPFQGELPSAPNPWSAHRLAQWAALGLPLAFCALLSRRLRTPWAFFATVTLLSGLFLLGRKGGVFWVYHQLPGGDLFRAPMRMSFVYLFAASMLWGLGAQGIADLLRTRGRKRTARIVPLVLLAIVALDMYARTELPHGHPIATLRTGPAPEEFTRAMRTRAGGYRFFEGSVLLGQMLPRPPALGVKAGMFNRLHAAPDYEPSMPGEYARYFFPERTPRIWAGGLDLAGLARGGRRDRLLDLMSLRYFAIEVDPKRSPRIPPHLQKLFPDGLEQIGTIATLKRESALPRAYAVACGRIVPDRESALSALLHADFDPQREVVVTRRHPETGTLPAIPPCDAQASPPRRPLALAELSTQHVVVEAACEAPCLAVLTDLHYPGWSLTVDGEPRPIEVANGIFRGVVLEAGVHELHFRYRPWSSRLGGLLAAGVLVATFCGMALRRPGP